MMRVQKTAKSVLLMLCFATCVCLFLTRFVNKPHKPADEKPPDSVEVAIAKVSLPAGTVINNELINKETVSKDELPEGPLPSTLQILGRVLRVPVVEGQVLTESCFVTSRTEALLAASLPYGMRAVKVLLPSKAMPDRALLYPGCTVDVLVSFRLPSSAAKGQALSTTMLRGIQVLAVSGDAVVTLLVTPKQAEALSLAVENGSISFRNPSDKKNLIDDWELQPPREFYIGPCKDNICKGINQPTTVQIRQKQRWEVTVIRGRTIQRISSEGLSSLSTMDEDGDRWVLNLASGQALSRFKDGDTKSRLPLLVKTDVRTKGRSISIGLVIKGQAGEVYQPGVTKNGSRVSAPKFKIIDETGKVLTSGRFKYG